jgi:hypothetical protein
MRALADQTRSLDDAGRYRPQMVFYTVRAQAWDHLGPDLPKFEHMPPPM